jgi:hypothetical protein
MLARSVQLLSKDAIPGSEDSETLVERLDGVGNVLGRWIITWVRMVRGHPVMLR